MIFNKLRRVWSHGYLNYIPNFKESFPELKHLDNEELADRFFKMKIDFYSSEEESVSFLIRITLPIALIVYLCLLITLPIKYIITGTWSYSPKTKISMLLLNWFRMLKLP